MSRSRRRIEARGHRKSMARSGKRREPRFDDEPEDWPDDDYYDDDDELRAEPRRAPRRRARPKPKRRSSGSLIGALLYWGLTLAVWGAIGLGGLAVYYGSQLPPIDQLQIPKRPPNIAILSADGEALANRGDTGGAAMRLADLPPFLPKAFVAIEDRRFYSHWGVDPVGIGRALTRNIAGRGGISCACGSHRYTMQVRRGAVDITCADCGGRLRIPAAADSDLDDLCCRMTLTIPGK